MNQIHWSLHEYLKVFTESTLTIAIITSQKRCKWMQCKQIDALNLFISLLCNFVDWLRLSLGFCVCACVSPNILVSLFMFGSFAFVWVIMSLSISSEIICCPLSPEYEAAASTAIAGLLFLFVYSVTVHREWASPLCADTIVRERACAHGLYWPFRFRLPYEWLDLLNIQIAFGERTCVSLVGISRNFDYAPLFLTP